MVVAKVAELEYRSETTRDESKNQPSFLLIIIDTPQPSCHYGQGTYIWMYQL